MGVLCCRLFVFVRGCVDNNSSREFVGVSHSSESTFVVGHLVGNIMTLQLRSFWRSGVILAFREK